MANKESVLLQVEINEKTLKKNVANITTELFKLTEANKQLKKAAQEAFAAGKEGTVKRLTKEIAENEQAIRQLTAERKNLNKTIDLNKAANDAETGSYEKLLRQQQLAQIQLKLMEGTLKKNKDGTYQLTEAYIQQSAKVTKAKEAIIAFDKGIKDGRTSVGLYEDATEKLEGAIDNLTNKVQEGNDETKKYAKTIEGLEQNIADLQSKLDTLEIDTKEFDETRATIDKLQITVDQAKGKIDELGNREPKNSLKKSYDDLNDSIMGVVAAFQLSQIFGAKDEDTQKRIAIATTALAVATSLANVKKGIGAAIDTIALVRTKAVTAATLLYSTVVGLLTGSISLATVATQIWGAVTKVALGPIGLLIAAAGAIIAAITYFTSSVDDAANVTKNLRAENDALAASLNNTQKILQSEIDLMKARSSGTQESLSEIQKAESASAQQRIESLKKQAQNEKAIYQANTTEYLAALKLQAKGSLEQFRYDADQNKEEMKNSKEKYQELIAQIEAYENEEKILKIQHTKEMIELTQQEWEQRLAVVDNANKYQIDLLKASGASEGAILAAQLKQQNDIISNLYEEKWAAIAAGADVHGKEVAAIQAKINEAEQRKTILNTEFSTRRREEAHDYQMALLESEVRLVTDARKRELAAEQLALRQRLADIKGNGETAVELRASLTEESRRKEQEINEKYDTAELMLNLKTVQETLELKLALVENDAAQRLELNKQILKTQEAQELAQADLTEQQIANIRENYRQKEAQLELDAAEQLAQDKAKAERLRIETEIQNAEIAGQNTIALRKELAQQERDAVLNNDKATAEERLKAESDYLKKINDLNKEASAEKLRIVQGYASNLQSVLNSALEFSNGLQKAETDALVAELDARLQAGNISQAQYETRRKQILTEQAKKDKQAAIFKATIDGAAAVVGALPNIPLSIAAGIAAALNIGLIAATPIPQFRRGGVRDFGIFGGRSHEGGGTRGVFSDGTRVEVEKDEAWFVLNKRATRQIARLSRLNESTGGVPFMKGAKGLVFNPNQSSTAPNLTTRMDNDMFATRNQAIMLSEFMPTPVVTVEAINAGLNQEAVRVDRANI